MATLHFRERSEWYGVELNPDDSPIALSSITASDTRSTVTAPDGLLLSCVRRGGTAKWYIHIGTNRPIFINGMAFDTGIRVLGDRDSINWAAGPGAWFSLESSARVESFPGADDDIKCPRCRLVLDPGCDAVCCWRCGVWHHEMPAENLNCWSHADFCASCPQPTDMDTDSRWSPEAL